MSTKFFQFEGMSPDNSEKLRGNSSSKTSTPTRFLKLDDLFSCAVEGYEEYCPVFDFCEGLKTENNESVTAAGHAHGTATWSQSNFTFMIPFGDYYPSIRNAIGSRRSIAEGKIVEKSFLNGELSDVVTYTLENCRIESVERIAANNQLELVVRAQVVTVEVSKVDPLSQAIGGNSVSTINNATMKIE